MKPGSESPAPGQTLHLSIKFCVRDIRHMPAAACEPAIVKLNKGLIKYPTGQHGPHITILEVRLKFSTLPRTNYDLVHV